MDIPIIYEDAEVLALNKPAGVAVHGDMFTRGGTVADWLLEHYPALREVGEPMLLPNGETALRPGIVHRLDKDTSGVLVVTKTPAAFQFIKEQFQAGTVRKTYRALVYGEMKLGPGEMATIDRPIGRSRNDPRRRLAGRGASGKLREAVTHYRVLESFPGYTYLEVMPETGRTHQIRVHLQSISHPVVCDGLYALGRPCPPPLKRQALHAAVLELTLPTGTQARFEAELPKDFQEALDALPGLC